MSDGHAGHVRIGHKGIAHSISQSRRFHHKVIALRRYGFWPRLAQSLDHLEDDEGDDALIAGRQLDEVEPAIGERYGVDVAGARGLGGKIVEGMQPTELLELSHHVARGFALVEAVAAVPGDALEASR